jgi:transcriptional antiterminator RfaH
MSEPLKFAPTEWYALYVKPRHEKIVNVQLQGKNIESYLPLRRVLKQWSDRKKWVEEPLFRSYLFIHTSAKDRERALYTHGVLKLVTFGNEPARLREEEINAVRRILAEDTDVESCPLISVGDPIEIVRGPLMGIRGRLEEIRGTGRLVMAIDSIKQALRFSVNLRDVKVVK